MEDEIVELMVADAPVQPAPRLPLRRWLTTLHGTDEAVYAKVLAAEAKGVALTAESWRLLLEDIKGRPAHQTGHRG